MRMMASRYTARAQPAQIKRSVAQVAHISAPLKGLSLSSKLVQGDPLTAPILDNWVVEENRILSRPGVRQLIALAATTPIETLVPFYGNSPDVALAQGGKLFNSNGTLLKDGFTGNDWSWTAFSNLGVADYTVMVNGKNGVWSWDGATAVKETVTAPAGKTYIVPDKFHIVMSHMNRLWFADQANLAIYYLPIQTKAGEVKEIPLNAIFKRGGQIRAVYTWTLDGGAGMDDQLVVFTTNGECAVFGGVDPDSDWQMIGVYRFDSPMSKHCVVQYGGELYALISTGLVPMSTTMRAESEQLGKQDKNVVTVFRERSQNARGLGGWQVLLDHTTGRVICNMPLGGANQYKQMIRHMPNPVWASWSALKARSWAWVNNRLLFGSDDGKLYWMDPVLLNDDSQPIKVDVQAAWSDFRNPAIKHFKMIKPYVITDGTPKPFVDIRVDYDESPLYNQPDISYGNVGSMWDTATWDEDYWAGGMRLVSSWNGVAEIGNVGAPRLTAQLLNCQFALSGWDVIYETGSVLG